MNETYVYNETCTQRFIVALKPKQLRYMVKYTVVYLYLGLPCDSDGKKSAYTMGVPGSIPGLGRSPGERNGNPLQYSCLEDAMDRGTWWATVHGITEFDLTE